MMRVAFDVLKWGLKNISERMILPREKNDPTSELSVTIYAALK